MTQVTILLVSQIIESKYLSRFHCRRQNKMSLKSDLEVNIRKEPKTSRRGANNRRNRNVPEMTKVFHFMSESVHWMLNSIN